jgi:hypothetical protein
MSRAVEAERLADDAGRGRFLARLKQRINHQLAIDST